MNHAISSSVAMVEMLKSVEEAHDLMAFRKIEKSGEQRDPPVTGALNPIGLDINSLSDASPVATRQHACFGILLSIFSILTVMVAC